MTGHKIYKTWKAMKARCTRKNGKDFKNYCGRGIKVCDRWQKFENFRDDMLPTWKKGLTIDRIDVNGDYSPENCQWATTKEQSTNKRDNIKYMGVCISEWAKLKNIKYTTIYMRISRGWTLEDAINTPV